MKMDYVAQAVTPLIYTSKGNLPIDSLHYSREWKFSTTQIEFSETYTLSGEVVKHGVHVYKLPDGTEFNLTGGNIGGGPVAT
jgi:hypothetical protein